MCSCHGVAKLISIKKKLAYYHFKERCYKPWSLTTNWLILHPPLWTRVSKHWSGWITQSHEKNNTSLFDTLRVHTLLLQDLKAPHNPHSLLSGTCMKMLLPLQVQQLRTVKLDRDSRGGWESNEQGERLHLQQSVEDKKEWLLLKVGEMETII